MIRLSLIASLALMVAALAVADDTKSDDPEPPVRLKKKVRPEKKTDEKPAPKKEEPKEKKEGEPKEPIGPDEPAGDEKEILERINKNLRESADRLAKKDAGEATRQTQRDVVKDLDALIAQDRRKQQQQQQDQQPNAGNAGGRKTKEGQRTERSSRQRRTSKSRAGNPRSKPESSSQANQSNQGGAGKNRNDGPQKMADFYKERWGELPESLRQEIDAYARERFMPRYTDLLKQYYSTIAERGRRKESDR